MGKKYYLKKLSDDYEFDSDDQDDDEHLVQFGYLLFNELLCNIKKVPFDYIINSILIDDGITHNGIIKSNSLSWLYTADRLNINGKRVYSFRFGSPCNPDYYESFTTKYHPYFALTNQTRHNLQGWYYYTGHDLPKEITNYLKITKIMNEQKSYGPKIFVNNKYERLDIEFDLQSGDRPGRITITFEPGYPAVA